MAVEVGAMATRVVAAGAVVEVGGALATRVAVAGAVAVEVCGALGAGVAVEDGGARCGVAVGGARMAEVARIFKVAGTDVFKVAGTDAIERQASTMRA